MLRKRLVGQPVQPPRGDIGVKLPIPFRSVERNIPLAEAGALLGREFLERLFELLNFGHGWNDSDP